jgi:hypothetical protein
MDAVGLRGFATESRSGLVGQMRARVAQLLADPNVELEYRREIAALRAEAKIHGEAGVAEIAAYTWFNRLTAARYMDANGFSGPYRVVSPEAGSVSALPEILTRAQAGEFSEDVPTEVRSAVAEVLSGGRASADPDLEAYGLLAGAVFQAWHQPMPEVFPAAGDWIRLLTPPDILSPTSVRARAVEVMDVQACANVEVVGWLYQFYIAELKEQINDSKAPIDATTLAPVTQLFTPHWIVRYLVENSLGRLWLRSRPSSRLRDRMNYYVETVAGQHDTGVKVGSAEEIRVLDPACGSGHMLTYAFDLLYAIYEEEGYSPASIPELILTHNLRGLEIDERAAQLASFALAMKARGHDRRFLDRKIQPDVIRVRPIVFEESSVQQIVAIVTAQSRADGSHVDAVALGRLLYAFVDADSFGSLIRVDQDAVTALAAALPALEQAAADLYASADVDDVRAVLRQAKALTDNQYHAITANPPYLGARNMGPKLKNWTEKNYPAAKSDLLTAFMVRAAELCVASGHWGMIVLPSWMFLTSFAAFRQWFLASQRIESLLHLGRGLFGSDFGSDAFVLTNTTAPAEYRGTYRRLFENHVQVRKPEVIEALFHDTDYNSFQTKQSDFQLLPEELVVYWLSEAMKAAFVSGTPLAEDTTVRQGLATADNNRFVRQWFEVCCSKIGFGMASRAEAKESGRRWFPYNKGGDFRRWWGNQDCVVNWEDDGKDLWDFRPRSVIRNPNYYFKPSVSWSNVSLGASHFRAFPAGFIFDVAGMSAFPTDRNFNCINAFLNSSVLPKFLSIFSPTLNTQIGDVAKIPIIAADPALVNVLVDALVSLFRADWNDYETSWDFEVNPLVALGMGSLEAHAKSRWVEAIAATERAQELEQENNRYFATLYGLEGDVECEVPLSRISLKQNPYFRYAPSKGVTRTKDEYQTLFFRDVASELVSYGVGCIMGRYSIDKPGLILAEAGSSLADFDRLIPDARFRPDTDGVLAITTEHYFDDDIVTRLREFLTAAFGAENLEANITWLETALGAGKRKSLRDYFLADFHTDHVKTYSKRPIYWQVSSPKGGFNALFYLHRYTPATLGVIHQDFAEELLGKLEARLDTIDHALPSADKREAIRLGKERDTVTAQRREIRDWIDTTLFPLASTETALDLDDGVKHNYPKLFDALKKITGL